MYCKGCRRASRKGTMVLSQQIFPRILGNLAELVVDVFDPPVDVGGSDDRRLIQRVADVFQIAIRAGERVERFRGTGGRHDGLELDESLERAAPMLGKLRGRRKIVGTFSRHVR